MQKFINELFGINNETSAPILISIVVFISGFFITWAVRYASNYVKRRNYREIFKDMVKHIQYSTAQQAPNFSEFAKTLEVGYTGEFRQLKTFTLVHFDSIEKLNFDTLYLSFTSGWQNVFCRQRKKKRLKAFNKCFAVFQVLKELEHGYRDELKNYRDNFREIMRAHNSSVADLENVIRSNIKRFEASQMSQFLGEYLYEIDQIRAQWLKSNHHMNPQNYNDIVSEPIWNLGKRKEYRGIHAVAEISEKLTHVNVCYGDLRSQFSSTQAQMFVFYRRYRTAAKILEVCHKML